MNQQQSAFNRYAGVEGVVRTFGDKEVVTTPIAEVSKALYDTSGAVIWSAEQHSFDERVELIRRAAEQNRLSDFVLPHVITTNGMDRMNDVVLMSGAQLGPYKKNPIVCYGHWHDMAVGNSKKLTVTENAIISDTWFHGLTEASIEVAKLSLSGVMPMVSIGFIPLSWEDEPISSADRTTGDFYPTWNNSTRTYKKWELLEYSVVPIPANPSAGELKSIMGGESIHDVIHKGVQLGVIRADSMLAATTQGKIAVRSAVSAHSAAGQQSNKPNTKVKNMNEELTSAIAALDAAHSQVMAALTTAGESFDVGAVTAIRANAVGAIRIGNDMATLSKAADVQAFAKNIVKVNTPVKDAAESWLESNASQSTPPPVEEPTTATDPEADPNADPSVTLAFFSGAVTVKAGAVLSAKNKADLNEAKARIEGVLAGAEPTPEEGKSVNGVSVGGVSREVYEADMKAITKTLAEIKANVTTITVEPVKKKIRLSDALR